MPFKNKEDKAAWQKKYNQVNKEKKQAYYEANKDRLTIYKSSYYKDNREHLRNLGKIQSESEKDGLYTVYCLEKENYVGVTNALNRRLREHRSKAKRYIEDVEVMGKYATRAEALAVEAKYHSMGYLGANAHHEKTTTK